MTASTTAVADWLARTHTRPDIAYSEWAATGVALLPLGWLVDAVRIPTDTIAVRPESGDPGSYVAEMLDGPIIVDPGRWIYALVEGGTAAMWSCEGVTVLGKGSWLGVPELGRTAPPGVYWAALPRRPGHACTPGLVAGMLSLGMRHGAVAC